MNTIFPIIRIVCGLVLIVVATSRYFSVRAQIAEGAEIQLFGYTASGAPWQLMLALGAALVLGIALIALGGFTLVKKLNEA